MVVPMKPLRLLTGILLLLAALAGLAFCVIAIFGVQQTAPSISTQATTIFDSTKEAVVFLKHGTIKVQALVAETKTRAQALDATLVDLGKRMTKSATGK